jgi:hypothetical protein
MQQQIIQNLVKRIELKQINNAGYEFQQPYQVVDIFEKYGWSWGGNWRNPDYQHFFKRDVNKRVKNKLYDDLGIDNPYLQNQPKGRIDRFKKFVKKLYESNEVDKPALK